jgi:hypothetical protein
MTLIKKSFIQIFPVSLQISEFIRKRGRRGQRERKKEGE